MRLSQFATLAATTLALGLSPGSAHADAAGDKALSTVEAALNRAKTLYFEFEATTQEAGKAEKTAALNVWIKGEKRLVQFTAPADMKGTKLLVVSPAELYVYLPAFGKVRRVATTTNGQPFLGLAFSAEDFATRQYSDRYAVAASASAAKEFKLTLTPKSGQTPSFARIDLTASRDHDLPSEIKYSGPNGKLVRTETRLGYSCDNAVCTPGTVKMVIQATGLWTKLTRKKVKVNESLSDDVFSKRNLEE